MSRYATTQAQPSQPTVQGDAAFTRLNMKSPPDKLSPGEYALLQNGRSDAGDIVTRGGTITPLFANIEAFGQILGSAIYNNPNGDKVMLVACPTQVLMIRAGAYPTSVAIPAGVTLSGAIEFSQQFAFVLLHRGTRESTLVWDGLSAAGFVPVTQLDPANTARMVLPDVAWSVNMNDRTIFPFSKDQIGATDIGDYSSYDPDLGVFRVNAGTADPIVGAFPFPNNNVFIGKTESWDVLTNFTGDFTNPASPDYNNPNMEVLSSTIGLKARKSFVMIGADAAFLSETGFYRIQQIDQNRLATSALPLGTITNSAGENVNPIQPLIDRINMNAAAGAVSATLGPRTFWGVPLDGSAYNNAVLVYNNVGDFWEAFDTWDAAAGMRIDNLLVTDYQGQPRVYAVNHGSNAIHILYLETAYTDTTAAGELAIPFRLRTRGYATLGWNPSSRLTYQTPGDFNYAEIGLRTWNPSVSVSAVFENAGDSRLLTSKPVTKSRTKYYRFGLRQWDPTNANNDFGTAGREDYSTVPGTSGIAPGSRGITPMTKQEGQPLRMSVKARGAWMSLDVTNSQGVVDVTRVRVDGGEVTRQIRRAA